MQSMQALINTFDVAPFTYTACGFFNFNCIPQKDTTRKVDAVSEWPMQRFAYRKIGPRQGTRPARRRSGQRRHHRRVRADDRSRRLGSQCRERPRRPW